MNRRRIGWSIVPFGALAAAGCLGLATPADLGARQVEDTATVSGYTAAAIERFARMHLEIAEIRDELHQDLARFHEAGRRGEARERADARLAALFEEYEVDREAYEAFVGRVAVDQALRDAFEAVVARLRDDGG